MHSFSPDLYSPWKASVGAGECRKAAFGCVENPLPAPPRHTPSVSQAEDTVWGEGSLGAAGLQGHSWTDQHAPGQREAESTGLPDQGQQPEGSIRMQRPSDSSKQTCFRKSPSGCGTERRPQGDQCWDGARV